jgi:hypothetical protein
MAIYDALFEFLDDGQLIGTDTTDYNAATAKELDWVDSDLEMGSGNPVYLNIRVGTTAYSGGTSVDFKLFADDTSEGHDSSSLIVLASGARTIGVLTAGAWVLRVPLPVDVDAERYLQIGATFAGTVAAGTINAWLDHGPQSSYDTQVWPSNI